MVFTRLLFLVTVLFNLKLVTAITRVAATHAITGVPVFRNSDMKPFQTDEDTIHDTLTETRDEIPKSTQSKFNQNSRSLYRPKIHNRRKRSMSNTTVITSNQTKYRITKQPITIPKDFSIVPNKLVTPQLKNGKSNAAFERRRWFYAPEFNRDHSIASSYPTELSETGKS